MRSAESFLLTLFVGRPQEKIAIPAGGGKKPETRIWPEKKKLTNTLADPLPVLKKKKSGSAAGKFLSGTENMKFWILVFFSFFFFLFSLGGFFVVSGGFHCR